MVGLLALAAKAHEGQLAAELEQLIQTGAPPDLSAIERVLAPPRTATPSVNVQLPQLAVYDAMMGARS